MKESKKNDSVGANGEDIATNWLNRKGFHILERNYRKPWGEIDIIARHNDIIHFIEVKSRSFHVKQGEIPEELIFETEGRVAGRKKARFSRIIESYLLSRFGEGDAPDFQIDVITVFINPDSGEIRVHMVEDVLL